MTGLRTRRRFLGEAAAGAAALAVPSVSFAAAPTDRRLVVMLMRGGLDGLALVAPHADENYAATRGELALPPPGNAWGVLDLDGFFGLHPAALELHDMWQGGQLAFVQAVATPYRKRKHLEAQAVLENGTAAPTSMQTGWLNRTLAALGAKPDEAVALSRSLPPILRGKASSQVWGPPALPRPVAGFFVKMALLYNEDPVLGPVLQQGLDARRLADRLLGVDDLKADRGAPRPDAAVVAARLVADQLAADTGARIAVIETSGWDTHANQGTVEGPLARRLRGLNDSLETLAAGLAPVWDKTVVVGVSEFGRTAIVNGTGGTDHGTGGLAILAGGPILGGRVHGEWPGLAPGALRDGRDLAATTDLRAILKAVLGRHLGLDRRILDGTVFPDSGKVAPMEDLVL